MSTLTFHFLSDYFELTKPRICLLALMMAALGYFWGSPQFPIAFSRFFFTLLGTALVGGAAGTLNQYMERSIDAQMWRTMNRPLPAGRVIPKHAFLFGLGLGICGIAILMFFVNPLTAVLGGVTLLFYLGIYTPSKPMTAASTLIGAIPGALPPVMGWTAATGHLGGWAFLLFAIVFVWQIPHFLSIAFMHEEDYARGSLPVLSLTHPSGEGAKQIITYALVLVPMTLLPSVWGHTGKIYLIGALIAGFAFVGWSIQLARNPSRQHAKHLFIASIVYLPVLALLMVWDRVN